MRWSLLVVVALLGCSTPDPAPEKPTPEEQTRARAARLLGPNHLFLGPGTKVGFLAARTLEGGGRLLEEQLAVVGETATSWLVETRNPSLAVQQRSFPELEHVLLGLTVRKSDGAVTKAVAGAPGQALSPIGLFPGVAPPPPVATDGVAEVCSIALGTFDARRLDGQGTTTWTGTSGPTKDLVLKVDGEERYELAELPREEALEVGAGKLLCRPHGLHERRDGVGHRRRGRGQPLREPGRRRLARERPADVHRGHADRHRAAHRRHPAPRVGRRVALSVSSCHGSP